MKKINGIVLSILLMLSPLAAYANPQKNDGFSLFFKLTCLAGLGALVFYGLYKKGVLSAKHNSDIPDFPQSQTTSANNQSFDWSNHYKSTYRYQNNADGSQSDTDTLNSARRRADKAHNAKRIA